MTTEPRHSELGLVELFLGSIVLAVAVLGTVGGLMTGIKAIIDAKDEGIASSEARAVIEEFRKAAGADFAGAVRSFQNRSVSGSGDRTITSRITLDETRYYPPIDLNGDGDFNDTEVPPGKASAAYVETSVYWGQDRALSFVTLVQRTPGDSVPATPPGSR